MTASMDHPRIVYLIGVVWDSLSDLCVVMEYMEGGDLRTLLVGYEASNHPVGIDREKVSIVLHACHALTYLHSLSPPIVYRDLKSRNILLKSRDGGEINRLWDLSRTFEPNDDGESWHFALDSSRGDAGQEIRRQSRHVFIWSGVVGIGHAHTALYCIQGQQS